MYEIVKEDLEEKMQLILSNQQNKEAFVAHERNYIEYVGKSRELAGIIRQLILEKKIGRRLLLDIFMIFMAPHFFFRHMNEEEHYEFIKQEPVYPPFWNEKIDDKFHFRQYLANFKNLNENEIAFRLALWNYHGFPYEKINAVQILNKVYSHFKKSLPAANYLHTGIMQKIGAPTLENGKTTKIMAILRLEGGRGYLEFNDSTGKILIGKEDTRQVKLLQTLTEPHFGIHKTIPAIFEAIRLPKDNRNNALNNSTLQRDEMLRKIQWTQKELQKKLIGKISFHTDRNNTLMWIELEG